MFERTISMNIDDAHHDIIVIKKTPICCYQDCMEYGTESVGCLKMCKSHAEEARD